MFGCCCSFVVIHFYNIKSLIKCFESCFIFKHDHLNTFSSFSGKSSNNKSDICLFFFGWFLFYLDKFIYRISFIYIWHSIKINRFNIYTISFFVLCFLYHISFFFFYYLALIWINFYTRLLLMTAPFSFLIFGFSLCSHKFISFYLMH